MMEHKCRACGAVYYNNETRPKPCECGSSNFNSEYDEEIERENDEEHWFI